MSAGGAVIFRISWCVEPGGAVLVLDSRSAQLIGERDREVTGRAPRWAGIMRRGSGSMGYW